MHFGTVPVCTKIGNKRSINACVIRLEQKVRNENNRGFTRMSRKVVRMKHGTRLLKRDGQKIVVAGWNIVMVLLTQSGRTYCLLQLTPPHFLANRILLINLLLLKKRNDWSGINLIFSKGTLRISKTIPEVQLPCLFIYCSTAFCIPEKDCLLWFHRD